MPKEYKPTTPRIPPTSVGLLGPMVKGFAVGQWCESADGSGDPVAVAVVLNIAQLGDVVLRLHSRRAVNEMIDALIDQRDEVFPS